MTSQSASSKKEFKVSLERKAFAFNIITFGDDGLIVLFVDARKTNQ